MGFVNYLEEIVDRHIETAFQSDSSLAHGYPIGSREEAKALFAPLLDAIRFALTLPEAEHLHRVERANWDRVKAEYDLSRAHDDLDESRQRCANLENENRLLTNQIADLSADRDSLRDQLERRQQEHWKNAASLKTEIERLERDVSSGSARATKLETKTAVRVADLEATIAKKDKEIAALERAAMHAQVTRKY